MTAYHYSNGLRATIANGAPTLVSIQAEIGETHVKLVSVSARNLDTIRRAKVVTIPRAEWNDRPRDAYDSLVESRWMLNRCGWSIAGDDE